MSVDINTLRSAATVLGFVAFMLVVWRTWRRAAQPANEAAARLPFTEDDQQGGPQ